MTSRYFRPKGGFSHAPDSKLRLDEDGTTTRVYADGSEVPDGTTNHHSHFVPAWSATELENLVKSGLWEELSNEPKPLKSAPESVALAAHDEHEPIDHAA